MPPLKQQRAERMTWIYWPTTLEEWTYHVIFMWIVPVIIVKIIRNHKIKASILKGIHGLGQIKPMRFLRGGVWVKFKKVGWVRSSWADKENGYLVNKFDGGQFHVKFNLIEKVEDYGHKWRKP